jgi:uncharacterized membrane protein
MELDDLKNIWQKTDLFKPKLEEEIAVMLKGRSHSIIGKLKRNVWLELVFTTIASGMLLYYSLSIPSATLRWAFVFVLISFLVYIVYYIKKINLLNRFEASQGNIKANLENLINDLHAYLKFYNTSYSLLYPAYLLSIVLLAILDRGVAQFVESLRDWRIILFLVFLILFSLSLSLWFNKWYLKKLYGTHLQRLKGLLDDLQETS